MHVVTRVTFISCKDTRLHSPDSQSQTYSAEGERRIENIKKNEPLRKKVKN